ncbi:NAD(P)/FAD-dependent oxidoreductase [Verrucomicrobiaceae bacterium 227]
MSSDHQTIAIVGAGPAGSTLACLLGMRGIRTIVFDDDKRPPLLVGESLLPSVVPILGKLEIEDRVREFSVSKPGASFFHGSGTRVHFQFHKKGSKNPGYAYNVPRPQFDKLLRTRAEELGATFVNARASLQKSGHPERDLELSPESLQLAGLTEHPDLLVDGTGRTRLFARSLDLPAKKGTRKDAAYFAHFEDFDHDEVDPGQVVISVLDQGWSWRIPLQGKLSVGIVIDKEHAKTLGDSPEERLENAIKREPLLREKGARARRVTGVMTYTNYQLISEQGHGKGWVMLGDAFGFVDPMLSPGLFMAMESAVLLDTHLFGKRGKGLEKYTSELLSWHQSWQELIDYFYDGRLLRLYEAGSQLSASKGRWNPAHLMEKHVSRVIAGMASGTETRSKYNKKLLFYSAKHLTWDVPEIDFYAVK